MITCIQIPHTPIPPKKTLLEELSAYFDCRPDRLTKILRYPSYFTRVSNDYRGRLFNTTYSTSRRWKGRPVRFDSLTWLNSTQLMAYEGACSRMTVKQHYYARHGVWLKHPKLPCVVEYGARGHNRYYPIELLNATNSQHRNTYQFIHQKRRH